MASLEENVFTLLMAHSFCEHQNSEKFIKIF